MIIDFENNQIKRLYTPEWYETSPIKQEAISELVTMIVNQHKEMVMYIEELHNLIDILLEVRRRKRIRHHFRRSNK